MLKSKKHTIIKIKVFIQFVNRHIGLPVWCFFLNHFLEQGCKNKASLQVVSFGLVYGCQGLVSKQITGIKSNKYSQL